MRSAVFMFMFLAHSLAFASELNCRADFVKDAALLGGALTVDANPGVRVNTKSAKIGSKEYSESQGYTISITEEINMAGTFSKTAVIAGTSERLVIYQSTIDPSVATLHYYHMENGVQRLPKATAHSALGRAQLAMLTCD